MPSVTFASLGISKTQFGVTLQYDYKFDSRAKLGPYPLGVASIDTGRYPMVQ